MTTRSSLAEAVTGFERFYKASLGWLERWCDANLDSHLFSKKYNSDKTELKYLNAIVRLEEGVGVSMAGTS